jgi:hypothetical protein
MPVLPVQVLINKSGAWLASAVASMNWEVNMCAALDWRAKVDAVLGNIVDDRAQTASPVKPGSCRHICYNATRCR